MKGIEELKSNGFVVTAIVCDGRRGLINSFRNIPVQMCQFHQAAIVRRYINKKPRIHAAIELMDIVHMMQRTDKKSFEGALKLWHKRWKSFLNERTQNEETGKSHYTHKRL